VSKIIQIAVANDGENDCLYALTDDGKVFKLHDQETAFPRGARRDVGVWSAFWRPLPPLDVTMPVFVPTVAGVTQADVDPHWYADRARKAAAVAGRAQ
jgi:hypothetical protein